MRLFLSSSLVLILLLLFMLAGVFDLFVLIESKLSKPNKYTKHQKKTQTPPKHNELKPYKK